MGDGSVSSAERGVGWRAIRVRTEAGSARKLGLNRIVDGGGCVVSKLGWICSGSEA